jgi:hypothetical protein
VIGQPHPVDASTTRVNADAASGDNDGIVPTRNSRLLADRLPNAELKIFPDAGHRFLFQYPSEFARDVEAFLAWPGTTERSDTSGDDRRAAVPLAPC